MGGGELSRSKYRCPVSALGSVVGLIPLPPLCGPCREVGTSRGYRHPSPRSCLRLDGSLNVHLFALRVRQGAKSGLDPMLASQLQPGSQPIGKHGSWSSPRSKAVPSHQGGWRIAGFGSYGALRHVLSSTQVVLDAFKGWQCHADSEHRLMGHPLEDGELRAKRTLLGQGKCDPESGINGRIEAKSHWFFITQFEGVQHQILFHTRISKRHCRQHRYWRNTQSQFSLVLSPWKILLMPHALGDWTDPNWPSLSGGVSASLTY